jgi:hypothetical protein
MEAGPLKPPLPQEITPAATPAHPPVWAQRLLLVIEVGVAIWAGMFVLVLPWTRLWSENPLLAAWPAVHHILNLNFVRGMISGVGMIDVWMGILDALHYRDIR